MATFNGRMVPPFRTYGRELLLVTRFGQETGKCLTDPDPENPIVYSTDHEVYFQEIDNKGTLEDFLEKYMTKDEFYRWKKSILSPA